MAVPCSEGKPCKGASQQPEKCPGLGCLPVPSAGPSSRLTNAELILSCRCQSLFGFAYAYLVSGKQASGSCKEGLGNESQLATARACGKAASPLWPEPAAGGCERCPSETASLLAFLFMTCWTSVWQGWGTLKPSISVAFSVRLPTIAARRLFSEWKSPFPEVRSQHPYCPFVLFLFEQALRVDLAALG